MNSCLRIYDLMDLATLSFWITDRAIEPSSYPTEASLLVYAFHKFKQLYIKENTTYEVFLKRVYADIQTLEINYSNFVNTTNYLTAVYSRAFLILYEHRRKVMQVFKQRDSFDIKAAAFLLQQCETRNKRTPRPQSPDEVYEQLAIIANRLEIFKPCITGEQLIMFRNGLSGQPLFSPNVAKAVFFLSMLSQNGHLPHNWKTIAEKKGLLISTRTGKAVDAKYMRGVAYQYNVNEYKNVNLRKSAVFDISIWGEIARSVKNVVHNP